MKMTQPENPTHTDLWQRIQASENRIANAVRWGVGIAISVCLAAVALAVNALSTQAALNRDAAERLGASAALLQSVDHKVDRIDAQVRENARELRDALDRHASNPHAHHGNASAIGG